MINEWIVLDVVSSFVNVSELFVGRYKTLWLDASDPDATGDDETLATLKQVGGLYLVQ